jgi:hypothetical protein
VLLASAFFTILTARSVVAQQGPPYPRLANIYLHGAVAAQDIPTLAQWDVLVLGSSWTEAQLAQLRALNPDIKTFFYVCPYCMAVPVDPGDPWLQGNYDYVQQNDLWWRNRNGTIASDWPGVNLANITDLAPVGPQGRWRDFVAQRVTTLVASRPSLDGIFYDNFWRAMSWEQDQIQVDSDCNPTHNPAGCDGVMDAKAPLDSLWNHALRDLARRTRQNFDVLQPQRSGRPLAIVGNRAADYFGYLNGALYELFPSGWTTPDPGNAYGYNWNQEMFGNPEGYLVAPFSPTPYAVQILNAVSAGDFSAPVRSADFERHKRFTLVSALLGDGYYSLDARTGGHGSLWWEPEFDAGGLGKGYLGYPKGPMYKVTITTGPEILKNGSFANGSTSWQVLQWNATGGFAVDNGTYHSAPASGRITVTGVQPGGSVKLYQFPVPVSVGVGYTLAFWARASVPQNLLLHLYSDLCPGNRCLGDKTFTLSTTWTRYELSFVSSGTAGTGLDVFATVPGTVWIDDLSLREGDSSVYRRDFDKGSVILNYTTAEQNIVLGGTMQRLYIPGSTVFDGAAVTIESVPPSDARILLDATQPSPVPRPPAPRSQLKQNEPNPFNPRTQIRFTLTRGEHVHLAVYDLAGRLVKTLVDRALPEGEASLAWNGRDRFSSPVRSGVYFYRIETPSFTETRKMTLVQ